MNSKSFLVNAITLYSIDWDFVRKFVFGFFTNTLDVTPPTPSSSRKPTIFDIAFGAGNESSSEKPINSVFAYFSP